MLQPEHYLTTEERWEVLNTHPLFTGVCPKCGEAITTEESASDACQQCGWQYGLNSQGACCTTRCLS